jgi:hypothetical protein
MEIQNPLLANQPLRLRYARDEDGVPVEVRGDERGVFTVPDKDGEFLIATPGWKRARRARVAEAAPPPSVPQPAAPPPPAPVADTLPPPVEEEEPAEEEEIEEVDLDAMGKTDLLAFAAEEEIEVGSRWGADRIREHIREALGE